MTVENNQLENVSLAGLSNLIHFNAKNNRLKAFPENLIGSITLKYAYLNSNDIQEVKAIDLYKTKTMKLLDLNENPFPDEDIMSLLKMFPHVVYLSKKPDNDSDLSSSDDDEIEDWEYSIETSDLDSSDSDCGDLHDFDDLPDTLSQLSKYAVWR